MHNDDYLQAMGIDVWRPRKAATTAVNTHIVIEPAANETWKQLKQQAETCMACSLHQSRHHVVFGIGNQNADVVIVGEAPGAQEDKQGEPFVGRAGQLLDNMLKSLNLAREDIYLANILKCHPPENRDPSPEEVNLCTPFLIKQIALLKPKVIIAMGRIAAHFLLDSNLTMARLRGDTFYYGENKIPLIVTYHPAYLLRAPKEKRKTMHDLRLLKSFL